MAISTICTVIGTIIALGGVVATAIALAVKAGKFSAQFESLNDNVSRIGDNLNNLKERMTRVEDLLMLKDKDSEGYFSAKKSPRALNELGMKVFADMNGSAILEENKDWLFEKISAKNPQTALDVEAAAINACAQLVTDDKANDVKVFVYNYPIQKDGGGNEVEVTLQNALFILSLPLRDMYLVEHPHILQ
ncbi:MAG: hypothetical protein KBS70_08145 [Bacteroidales bacterium]|nr:hypothetical protein [Candidatus Colicola equi]